jgi:hypothetical protein
MNYATRALQIWIENDASLHATLTTRLSNWKDAPAAEIAAHFHEELNNMEPTWFKDVLQAALYLAIDWQLIAESLAK